MTVSDNVFYETVPTRNGPLVSQDGDIHVRWVMPEVFHDLPIEEDDEDRAADLLDELAEKVLPNTVDAERLKFAVICALGLDELRNSGAEYASVCVTAVDETPCSATVSVTFVDGAVDGKNDAVEALISMLAKSGDGVIERIQLPCGPAVSHIGVRTDEINSQFVDDAAGATLATWFIRAYIPLPNKRVLVMEMGTPTVAGWDSFSTTFGNIVSSIRLFYADGSKFVIPG